MIYRNGRLETSYSQLDTYLSCPYKWKVKYIDGITVEGQSKHLDYGLTIHETLETYFESVKNNETISREELSQMYHNTFNEKKIGFDGFGEMMEYYSAGTITIDSLYYPQNDLQKLMATADIVGVEEPFEVKIEIAPYEIEVEEDGRIVTKTITEVVIVGFIDLILQTPNGYIVIDHKSGNSVYKKDKLENNLQFPIYALAVLQKYGVLPYKCYYNFTKLNTYQEVMIDMDRLEMSERHIKTIFKEMKRHNQPPRPCPLCFWCGYGVHNHALCKYSSKWKPKKKED